MILITLGTQDKSFIRLLKEVDKLIDSGIIKDKVVAQCGYTNYCSDNIDTFDYIGVNKFQKLVSECDILITHGGVGSIMEGLKNNKKVIAVSRLKKYKEHTNDHQTQVVKALDKDKNIIGITNVKDLEEAFIKCRTFKPVKFISNKSKFVNEIKKIIDKY